jgi:hypothetical protein
MRRVFEARHLRRAFALRAASTALETNRDARQTHGRRPAS